MNEMVRSRLGLTEVSSSTPQIVRSAALTPIEALAFLLGMHAVTATTGDITSVLFGIPGEGTSAATIVDGHPMAKAGKATQALYYCFISSAVGGVLGVLVLIFLTPYLVNVALKFGPPELFWTAILGITVIGSLGSASVLKGLLGGAIGVWISLIGVTGQA